MGIYMEDISTDFGNRINNQVKTIENRNTINYSELRTNPIVQL